MTSTMQRGSAELMMMLLADARLPTGAHTQSAGLEPAMRGGLTLAQVPSYIGVRLRTVVAVEAATAVVARNLAATAGLDDLAVRLHEVLHAWAARTVSPALRDTSQVAARGYLRLARRLWPESGLLDSLVESDRPCRPVVLGVIAAICGLSGPQLVRLIGSDDVQTVASAALKLEPLDPAVSIGWVVAAHPEIDALAAAWGQISQIEQIPSYSAPLIEQWAQVHDRARQRLFRA